MSVAGALAAGVPLAALAGCSFALARVYRRRAVRRQLDRLDDGAAG